MKKLISMGLLTAFMFTCIACGGENGKRKGSRRSYRNMAQVEQVLETEAVESASVAR